MIKVLVASPVRRKPEILREFLFSLKKLEQVGISLNFLFVDNNEEAESSKLLKEFKDRNINTTIWEEQTDDKYVCNEEFHQWHETLMWKVANFKDKIIEYVGQEDYDFLFLVDSDLILHPKTLVHLTSLQKNIVSEVYWTKWVPDAIELPQVWVRDDYILYEAQRNEQLNGIEMERRINNFLDMLRTPGTYKVGGLGACTLISKVAISKGVSFKEIYNISMGGEDRHFCIRAVALGLDLWADTHYPPLHIYRESELEKVYDFYKKNGIK
ncbi:hypothetical protein GGQ84_003055 [Desulfitispora alkaliphila]|uniref:hypothetical protein n=1 Tax=Desulfitispora alkaliphila TaxID=622674 RepID=UPI003D23F042